MKSMPKPVPEVIEYLIDKPNIRQAARLIAEGVIKGHCNRVEGAEEERFFSFASSEVGISIGLPWVSFAIKFVKERFLQRYGPCRDPYKSWDVNDL